MLIYEVLHRHKGEDQKSVGFFSSPEKARDAIARSVLLPGFRDHPEGYYVVPRAVSGPAPENGNIWQAWVWLHDDSFDEEIWHILGFFSRAEDAAEAVNLWRTLNGEKQLAGLGVEVEYGSVFLDRLQWPKGFTEA